MGEYQSYEFIAVDRLLSQADQDYLNGLSSRAQVTSNSASYLYHYSDFGAGPEKLVERCFDLGLYIASFGVRRLLIRLPKGAIALELLEPYAVEGYIHLRTTRQLIIIDIYLVADAFYTWIVEGAFKLANLVPLREELLQGDFRLLYLAWLQAAIYQEGEYEPAELVEPPVPPNLKKLSPALKAFAEMFEVDQDWIAAGAEASQAQELEAEPLEDWIGQLSEKDCRAYLLRAVQGERHVGAELLQHLRQEFGAAVTSGGTETGRTLADVIELADNKQVLRERKAKQAKERAQKKHLQARQQSLRRITNQEAEALWLKVVQLLNQKKANSYSEAVELLVDLRDRSALLGLEAEFVEQMQDIWEIYGHSAALRKRFKAVKL